jgi:hypothetical protein
MKSRIKSIVEGFLRKWIAKIDIGTFSIAILTKIAGDALTFSASFQIFFFFHKKRKKNATWVKRRMRDGGRAHV